MTPPAISLRAATAADVEFLLSVYASTREQELAMTGWTPEQKAQFCLMQFQAQDVHYRQHYTGASFNVILADAVPAGRLYVARWPQEIRIIDIALLPAHRGQGIGTRFLCQLQEEAAASNRSLSIHVERFNPALRLYERLGFKLLEDKGLHLLMSWEG